jgi:arylformamidase
LNARILLSRGEASVDLSSPISLAIPMNFSGRELRHFGAPAPTSRPFSVPGFSGAVATGASCNCSTITFTPHCNGTHTECVGHLTRESLDAHKVIPAGLIPALVLSIESVDPSATQESTEPLPRAGDRLVTAQAIEEAWISSGLSEPRALVIRTSATIVDAPHYFSREAAAILVERGIEHLVVDLPSVDRVQDEGRLTAHRVFFGLPRESRELAESTRAFCTITELARVPEDVPDGWYLLELQVPALGGDAVSSRPLLYASS